MPKRITNVEILKIEVIHLEESKLPGETPQLKHNVKSNFTSGPEADEI